MNRSLTRFLSRTAAVALPVALLGVAAAAEHGGHGPPYGKIGLHALNLVVLLLVLFFAARKMVRDGLADRAANIRNAIEASDRAQAEARARYAELETRIGGLEQHLAEMRQEAEREGARDRERMLVRAEAESQAIAEAAQRTIRNETERAGNALRRHAATLAVDLASEQVAARITDDDHARLTREFLGAVQSAEVRHG